MISKKQQLSNEFWSSFGMILSWFTFRQIMGISPIKAFNNIYGDKWKKEGFTFDNKLDDELEKLYQESINKKVK